MKLIIKDDIGQKTVVSILLEDVEMTIGRQEGNDVCLNERNVSRNHARLIRKQGTTLFEDLNSYNGTKINGSLIQGQVHVQEGDHIELGCFALSIEEDTTNIAVTTGSQAISYAQTEPPVAKKKQSKRTLKPIVTDTEPAIPRFSPKPRGVFWIAGGIVFFVLLSLGWMQFSKKNLGYLENLLARKSIITPTAAVDLSAPQSSATTGTEVDKLDTKSTVEPTGELPADFPKPLPAEKNPTTSASEGSATVLAQDVNELASRSTRAKEAKPNYAKVRVARVTSINEANDNQNDESESVQTSSPAVIQSSAQPNTEILPSSLSPREELEKGIQLAQQYRYAQAVVLLEHSLKEDPSLIEAHLWLAKCYHSLKESDARLIKKVVFHYQLFVRLAPTHSQTPRIIAELEKYSQQESDHKLPSEQ
jgi:pSer/pThr/pTyr-binding forkhead associated (FHA) protein